MFKSKPLLAIAGFYFCYFAFNGLFSPYWGLYLASLAFPAWQIGILTSLTQINRIYAPTLWGWLSDRTGRRQTILRIAGLGGFFFFIPLLLTNSFWLLFVAVLLASFFWSAALPLVEATTMTLLKGDSGAYSRLRLWGSVGFVCATLVAGYIIEARGVAILPWAVIAIMASLALYSWQVPNAPVVVENHSEQSSFRSVLAQTEVRALLLSCFLMALAHGAYYSFYSIYVAEHGYAQSMIGWLWSIGVLAEIVVFALMPQLTQRFALRVLFLFGLAVATVRFGVIAFGIGSLALLMLAQIAHAFTFGSHHAVTMNYIHRYFVGRNQARGQALYIAVSFGLGGSLGGILAGLAWDRFGGVLIFGLSSVVALLGFIVAWFGLKK